MIPTKFGLAPFTSQIYFGAGASQSRSVLSEGPFKAVNQQMMWSVQA